MGVDDGGDGLARFEWITGRNAVRLITSPIVNSNPSYFFFNTLAEFFQKSGKISTWIGRTCFLILLFLFLFKKTHKNETVILLFLTGIAGGLLCLYTGVAYNELRSCSSIAYMYLCGAYPLVQIFHCLSVLAVAQTLIPLLQNMLQKNIGIRAKKYKEKI